MKHMKKILLVFVIAMTAIGLIGCKKDAIMHTIVFANTDMENAEVADGKFLARPSAPTKEGLEFVDWFKDAEFTALFEFEKVAITKNTTIYAKFDDGHEYTSIADALAIGAELEHDTQTEKKHYVQGTVKSISNVEYGNMVITDGENDIAVYGVWSSDGTVRYDALPERPVVGDRVYLQSPIGRFFETIELKSGWLVRMEKGEIPEFDETDYTRVSINDARGKDVDSKVIIEGVVSRITFANGMSPNGFFLVDKTGSMYVFDYDIAVSVSVGDTVEVAGVRKNFILEDEQNLAAKLGYEGAIQLADATLLSKSEDKAEFDKSWIEKTTVKDLLEADPKETNITGNIYEVTAFVKEVPGSGFTNYYINDLDGRTGSYSYSMNNGNDFKWLKEFDNDKLHTVYLAVINAKSTVSGLLYRFVPISIGEEVTYNEEYNAEFAVKYFGVDQFLPEYVYSPDVELITSVSSEALGIENVPLTYESSNENSIKFITDETGNTTLQVLEPGTATVTVKSVFAGKTYSEELTIVVKEKTEYEALTVSEATAKEDNTSVIVEGIVGPSLVNKTGFYLIDESGVIAVEMQSDELAKLSQGNQVVIVGNKTHAGMQTNEEGTVTALGQMAIREAEVFFNKFGSHDYSTASFKTGKTLEDFVDLDKLEEHSTDVYVFEADIFYEDRGFFTMDCPLLIRHFLIRHCFL